MSHDHEPIICPNCGYPAVKNYCAQCGQETHPHNESFWGLVMHFIGHYFHYDSKFWQTMKALLFSPGKLTVAYWNNQRMRYIPPVSLYIFISAVYFLAAFAVGNGEKGKEIVFQRGSGATVSGHVGANKFDLATPNADITARKDTSAFAAFMNRKADKVIAEHGTFGKFFEQEVVHNIPKVFFIMIPFMALILKLLFVRRKEALFLHHAIYSLHYHSFWFSIFFISAINPFKQLELILIPVLLIIAFVYMVAALRNAYSISRGKAIGYTFTVSFLYGLIFLIIFVGYLLVRLAMA